MKTETPSREPVCGVDYAWRRMDEPCNLMMINGVLVLERPLAPEDLATLLEERLLPIRRFRQRLVVPRSGRPYWEEDPDFDLAHHLVVSDLPEAASETDLRDAVSALMGAPIDYDRPLWRFHLLRGYRGGSVIMPRLHHCLGDGIALMLVLLSLTDLQPDGDAEGGAENPFRTLFRGVRHDAQRVRELAERVMPEGMRLMLHPGDALRSVGRWVKGAAFTGALGRLTFRRPDPKSALKGQLCDGKRAAWSGPIPVARVKEIQAALGGTMNDVLVTAVAGGLRRYLEHRKGSAVAGGLTFRAAIPVNLRPLELMSELGNQFGLVFLSLPIGIVDPRLRLAEVRRRMRSLRASAEPLVVLRVLSVMGRIPRIFQRAGVSLFGSKATAVLTNVPGPSEPLYLAGKLVQEIFFWVPQAGRLGIGISIFSYNGDVRIGIGTDAGLVPDPERIVAAIDDELDDLLARAESHRAAAG
jgi:WS/DGAT/MGAT family acyltransferase